MKVAVAMGRLFLKGLTEERLQGGFLYWKPWKIFLLWWVDRAA
jgi:hypothetical protein